MGLTEVVPGYLPAEHIETPMERLGRLNKHRNLALESRPVPIKLTPLLGPGIKPCKSGVKVAFSEVETFINSPSYDYDSEEEAS